MKKFKGIIRPKSTWRLCPQSHGRPKWPLFYEYSPHLDNLSPHLHSFMSMGDRRQREKRIWCGFVYFVVVIVLKILLNPVMTPKMHSKPERVKQTLSPGSPVTPGSLNKTLLNNDQSSSREETYMPITSHLLRWGYGSMEISLWSKSPH